MTMTPEQALQLTRRQFFGLSSAGIGAAALGSILSPSAFASTSSLHATPKAKRVIYLFQSGGPSHIDLFDYKPSMRDRHGDELPDSVRGDQRVTGMTSGQDSFAFTAPLWDIRALWLYGPRVTCWIARLMGDKPRYCAM